MSHIRSNRRAATLAVLLFLTGLTTPIDITAQDAVTAAPVVSSEYSISGREAMLRLELAGGRQLELSVRDGGAYVDGMRVGDATRGGDLDRQWRELLTRAMDATPEELPGILSAWSAPGTVGAQMKTAIDGALSAAAEAPAATIMPSPISDSVSRLVERINQLERTVDELEDRRFNEARFRERGNDWRFWNRLEEGFAGLLSFGVTWFVIFGIGFLAIFFGARKYIEGVADTVRHAPGRSLLVGIAGAILLFPVWVLGTILLLISIVGIPGILVWVPGLPIAAGISLLFGYIAVSHAVGESFAERRFYVTDWFKRGNSYYFIGVGVALLLVFFVASMVVHMAGPWLEPLFVILIVLGVAVTVLSMCVGFGAVLLSRAGTQPVRGDTIAAAEPDLFTTEEAGV